MTMSFELTIHPSEKESTVEGRQELVRLLREVANRIEREPPNFTHYIHDNKESMESSGQVKDKGHHKGKWKISHPGGYK
jgi:hypothetical protein